MRRYKQALYSGLSGLALAGLLVSFPSTSRPRPSEPSTSRPVPVARNQAARPRLVESYGKLPLRFEGNAGQTDERVKFLARGLGYALFLTGNEAVLSLSRPAEMRKGTALAVPLEGQQKSRALAPEVLLLQLVGSNRSAQVTGEDELPGKSNYFVGNDPRKWRTNVSNYAKVRYQDVYPGVDLIYYGNQHQLEYDFVLAPGADPRAITLEIETRNSKLVNGKSKIDATGDLVIATEGGEVRFHKPIVYQPVGAGLALPKGAASGAPTAQNRQFLDGRYVLKADNRIGFEVASYDSRKPLVIDPVLVYSTYLGGLGSDSGLGIVVDAAGNAYVTGQTTSLNYPMTLGAFQNTFGGPAGPNPCGCIFDLGDAFVTKLNPTGSGLVYSTYLGGSGEDGGRGIAVDAVGNVYLTGVTNSPNFPTTPGAFQRTFGGGFGGDGVQAGDAFVTKLNANGTALIYSTYLGGSANDDAFAITVDIAGNAYVSGNTDSFNFPTTAGAFQQSKLSFHIAAFVTKVNPAGSGLVYSTYLSGSGEAYGVIRSAVDPGGNAYVSGWTVSADFPTTPGAFQPTFGGVQDSFVTKLNPSGTGLVYSTYLGGSGQDDILGLTIDTSGNAYVTGRTNSLNFPTTSGAFQTAFAGGTFDAFVTKVNPLGTGLVYSTYVGGTGFDLALGIAVDAGGNAYVTGQTNSTNFPNLNGVQAAIGGGFDAFVTKLNALGTGLVYSTYLGGSGDDSGQGIALDSLPNPNAYLTGGTGSTNFPTTPGAFQTTFGGVTDAFVAKIASAVSNTPVGSNVVVQPVDSTTTTTPVTLTFSNVTQAGTTSLTTSGTGSPPPLGFKLGSPPTYYNLSTTAVFSGTITVCINYTGISFAKPSNLKLFHLEGGVWVDRTVSNDTVNHIICASVSSLSPFAIFEAVPLVNLSATSLSFGNQVISSTSAAQTVTLTNTGGATLNITSVASSPDFAQTNTCGSNLTARASCTFSVTFTPTAVGSRTGAIILTDDAGNSPQSISLSGTGQYNICALYDQTRSVNGGAVFPIKLQLCDASGNDLSSSSIVVHATAVTLVSGFSGTPDSAGSANPDNDFRFDPTLGPTGGYIFNLSTTGLASGTYSLQFTATGDPVTHSVNFGVK